MLAVSRSWQNCHSEHDPLIFLALFYALPLVVSVLTQSFHLYNTIVITSLGFGVEA